MEPNLKPKDVSELTNKSIHLVTKTIICFQSVSAGKNLVYVLKPSTYFLL